jgi:hypothetical protein
MEATWIVKCNEFVMDFQISEFSRQITVGYTYERQLFPLLARTIDCNLTSNQILHHGVTPQCLSRGTS